MAILRLTTLPVSETVPLLPLNVYAKSKIAAEQSVEQYRAQGLQTAVLRFSNVYGSIHDYADRVIPAFCRAAAFGGTIRIDGSDNIFDFNTRIITRIIKINTRIK